MAIKQSITPATFSQTTSDTKPLEVPKTLPAATLDDRVKSLEDTVSKIVTQVNSLKTAGSPATASLDSRLKTVEGAIADLTARVAALEKSTPAQVVSSSKSVVYIPLGSGGTVASVDWTSLNTFQITMDPSQYPGYTSMQLEVNMRLNQPGGTLSARLYNNSSGSSTSPELSSTSTTSSVYSSSIFTLPSGSKTYVLQTKTSDGSPAFLDTARIRVNF